MGRTSMLNFFFKRKTNAIKVRKHQSGSERKAGKNQSGEKIK